MAEIIGTTSIPSDEVTIDSGATVSIGLAFTRSVGFVGGMDTNNGSATAGVVQEVSNPTDAQNLFGDDSELHRAAEVAFQYPIDTLYAVGVTETETTESFSSTQTGTLTTANLPIFDQNLHGDHTITAQDTGNNDSVTVNVTYNDPPNTPSNANTINLNPVTGDFEADEVSSYDITYTYGDDYTGAITELLTNQNPRTVAVGTEDESLLQTLANDITSQVQDFNFMHGFGGADVREDDNDESTYATNYSDNLDEKRLSVVAPSRGWTDESETEQVRTAYGEAAAHASVPLGESRTKSELSAYASPRTDFTVSSLSTLLDAQVMPLRDLSPVENVKDLTTSTDPAFGRVYANQIADDGTERLHLIARDFIGNNFNTPAARRRLGRSLKNEYIQMRDEQPRLLDDFSVNVSPDSTDDNQVDVTVGLDIVDVVDTIDAEVSIGDVITNESG